MSLPPLRVAVLHYWLVSYRGGERVLQQILSLFPNADIYTLFADERICREHFPGHRVYASFLNRTLFRRYYKYLFPLYPKAISHIELQQTYDLIISSESGPIKGIQNPKGIPHLCYVHSPMRYCWGFTEEYIRHLPKLTKRWARILFNRLRDWDYTTKDLPDIYIANSLNVKKRLARYYQKDANVIYPPVADFYFRQPLHTGERRYYLYLGAITPYKGVDILVNAFNVSGKPLLIASQENELTKLSHKVKNNITLVANFTEEQKINLYSMAKALIFPAEEDFGIVPLEAMACGTPVIALKKGGATETVIEVTDKPDLSTGVFFNSKSEFSINNAVCRFETMQYQFDPAYIRSRAGEFRSSRFTKEFVDTVTNFLKEPLTKNS